MKSFNLDAALAAWRGRIVDKHTPEAGDLDELESGLLDRYDEFLLKGYAPAAAFAEASEKTSGFDPAEGPASVAAASAWSLVMNYAKVAGRNLRARRWYNLTNYFILSTGIITATLALLYLNYETSYERHLPEVDQKFRVGQLLRAQGYSMTSFSDYDGSSGASQLQQLRGFADVTGVTQAVQFGSFPQPKAATIGAREIPVTDVLQTNTPAEFLDYFAVPVLLGDPTALAAAPNTIMLTESTAERLYGADWRTAALDPAPVTFDTTNYTVVGVIADPPARSHFTYAMVIHQEKIDYWGGRTYLKLAAGADPEVVRQAINDSYGNINSRLAADELFGGVILQPLRSIHLGSDLLYELKPPGNVSYLYIIGIIALIILLLTVSNYTNLSIVMNAGRAREVGMRKVFGASTGQIAGQFLLETTLISLLTLPFVFLVLWWLIPYFNVLMGVELSTHLLADPGLPLLLLAVTAAVGLLAGMYPALYLARTQVQSLFKGKMMRDSDGRITARKVIITVQFALLIGLCSLTLFVNLQLDYIQSKDLGYQREGIVYVQINADSSRFETFRNEALRLPGVTAVGSGTPMGLSPFNQTTYKLTGTDQVFDDAHNIYLDYAAIKQLGISISVPQFVADPAGAPTRVVLINNTMAERLKNRFQLTDAELIGQTIIQEPEYTNEETGEIGFPYPIAGTFDDLHLFSLRESIDPMFLSVYRSPRYVYTASVSYGDVPRSKISAQLAGVYSEVGLSPPFVADFLEDNLTELYQDERRINTLATYFSLLALLMVVIGLVALTAYLTSLKSREISIRKVLGASHFDILWRFNLEYWPLLAVATVITVPLSLWGIGRWLEGFAYRVPLHALVFVIAVAAVSLITTVAVSVVSLRAARSTPARVLTRNS